MLLATVARLGGPWDGARPGQGAGAPVARASVAANTALARTLAGDGFLEFQPGEGMVVSARTSAAATGVGLREYLDGEAPVAIQPMSSPANSPAPQVGPQP